MKRNAKLFAFMGIALVLVLTMIGCGKKEKESDIISVVTAAPVSNQNQSNDPALNATGNEVLLSEPIDENFAPILVSEVDSYVRTESEVVPIPMSVFWNPEDIIASIDNVGIVMSCSYMVPYIKENLEVTDSYYTNIASALAGLRSELAEQAVTSLDMGREFATEVFSSNGTVTEEYYDVTQMEIMRADSSVVSLLTFNENYYGGVHPNYGYNAYTFDTASGRRITFDSILSDSAKKNNYKKVSETIRDEVLKITDAGEMLDFSVIPELIAFDTLTFTIDYQGVSVYINPYVIGPYAAGSFVVHLTFKKFGDLFNGSYTKTPDSYMIDSSSEWFLYDVDGDGEYDELPGPDGDYSDYLEAVMMRASDGRLFLYQHFKDRECGDLLRVYQVNGVLHYTLCGEIKGAQIAQVVKRDDWGSTDSVDPQDFGIMYHSNVCGETYEKAFYHLGEDGLPVQHSKYFSIVSPDNDLTLKRDLVFQLIDNETDQPVQNVNLPQGTIMKMLRTNREQVVDFTTETDKIYRISLDGIDPIEFFDGLMM